MSDPSYIDEHKRYWGPEFARLLEVRHRPEHDDLVAMGAFTVAVHIADNFRDGEFREEILAMLGIEL